MTEKQKRSYSLSISGLVAVILLLVGFAAWGNDTSRCASEARDKSESAEELSIENRTARVILETRVTQLEERMDDWEEIEPLIREMHAEVMGR